jgi:hypothetical protein
MSEKSAFKSMMEGFIEKSIASSPHFRKLVDSMTILALESKKVAEAILVLNNRLNDHEQLILKLVELQRNKPKDSLDIDLLKNKEKPSKPN